MLAKWCEITSCNGIIDLYEARKNKPHFIFWTVIMVAATTTSIFFTYKAFRSYIDTPFVTNVATIPNTTLELPEILLCYRGGFNVEAFREQNLSENFIHAISQQQCLTNVLNVSKQNATEELSNYMTKHNIGTKEFSKKFGFSCEDFVVSIYRNGNFFKNPCSTTSEEVITYSTGPCFSFKDNGVQWYPSYLAGLQLKLKEPISSYAIVFKKNASKIDVLNEFSLTIEKTLGYRQSWRSVPVPMKTKVEVILYPTLYKRFSEGNTCEKNETAYPTSNACFFECWSQDFINTCNCKLIDFLNKEEIPDINICPPFITCTNFSESSVKECNSKCLRKCEEWIFEYSLAYSRLDEDLDDEGLSTVFIYYNTMQYKQIEEVSSFTYDMAIANVGGQVGLWLGVSIVTIIQAIYYFVLSKFNNVKDLTINHKPSK